MLCHDLTVTGRLSPIILNFSTCWLQYTPQFSIFTNVHTNSSEEEVLSSVFTFCGILIVKYSLARYLSLPLEGFRKPFWVHHRFLEETAKFRGHRSRVLWHRGRVRITHQNPRWHTTETKTGFGNPRGERKKCEDLSTTALPCVAVDGW